ncbi:curlin [Fulvimarina sp. MAC8]|uniref:curlin n=1 Tax=Fulvimarina sp. MAC8 TaxID=3162874 RepID=UPI0032EE9A41
MTPSFSLRTVLTTLAIAAGSIGTFAVPASAGQLSFHFTPGDRQTSNALSTGLRLYSAYNDLKNGSVRQRGKNNSAGLAQHGRGNLGLVEQRGNAHSGTLQQTGDRNAYGLFQYGRGAKDNVVQTGRNRSGVTFSYGW